MAVAAICVILSSCGGIRTTAGSASSNNGSVLGGILGAVANGQTIAGVIGSAVAAGILLGFLS